MISLITPTHKPDFLLRLYESLKIQTCKDFEWVVVPNNNADVLFLPKEDWIRIVPYTEASTLIGAVKNFAFNQGKGEWLVEVDHDDELTSDCVEELIKAAKENKWDFIYSDSLDIMPDNTSNIFNPAMNWKQYTYVYKGVQYVVNKTFSPMPQSVSRIWFAPNHIRAWNRDFYKRIGGHDTTLKALDDQDLMCRTYIEGSMFKIEKVLYAYYYHNSNSFASQELNTWIQQYTMILYEKYIEQLMLKWCKTNNLMAVDINKRGTRPGYTKVNLDTDIFILKNNSIGLIVAEDALQLYKDSESVMLKIWNILADGGMLLSNTPSTDGRGAWQDPKHISFWNSNSFWYYTKSQCASILPTPVKFQATHIKNWYPTDFHKEHKIDYVMAHLTALKSDMLRSVLPGLTEI